MGSDTVIHTRRPETWASLSEADAALLDFLRRGGQTSELSPERTVRRTLTLLSERGRFDRLLKVADSEPPRVRAVLGAIGEEDIGHFFPNTDPRWKNVPSKIFLEEAAKQVTKRGGKIVNVDATLIAQAPKIYSHIAEMKKRIAAALGISEQQIGVKATTNELMGFIGREEGIAAMAVASVDF